MKTKIAMVYVLAILANRAYSQPAQNFPIGITLGNPVNTYINNWDAGGGRRTTEFTTIAGGLVLYSEPPETSPGLLDGGITLYGNPISIIPHSSPDYNSGTFDIWKVSQYGISGGLPAFRVDTSTNIASFNSVAVTIANGSLTIAGSPVLTTATAPGILAANGFVTTSNFNTSLANALPPTSAAWNSAYVARGNVGSGVGLLALGSGQATSFGSVALSNGSIASGPFSIAGGNGAAATSARALSVGYFSKAVSTDSIALGTSAEAGLLGTVSSYSTAIGKSTKAYSEYSTALGPYSEATAKLALAIGGGKAGGPYSIAGNFGSTMGAMSLSVGGYSVKSGIVTGPGPNVTVGNGSVAIGGVKNVASGDYSYGFGLFNSPNAAASISLGSAAIGGGTTNTWIDTDPLFELGNTLIDISIPLEPTIGRTNAITTLKNGQTTLTNREWKANSGTPLGNPPSTTDSGGNALVVDGHTVLNGKVIISVPQGDISMGIYGN